MNLASYLGFPSPDMGPEMTNFFISLILGLWLLVVAAFYVLIAGAAVSLILAGLRQSFGALARMRDLRLPFPPGHRHLNFPAPFLEMAVAAGIFFILATGFGWTASSLFRYCALFLLIVVPSALLLARHLKE
jgi:hypothetical protein